MKGKIIKGIGGFYYVKAKDQKLYECKAKGAFRNRNEKPLVGDDVDIEIIDSEKLTGNIISILPRLNELVRPAVSNVDQAVIIFAASFPEPNLNLLDRFLVIMEMKELKTIICFNKADLAPEDKLLEMREIYESAGYEVHIISAEKETGICELKEVLLGKTSVLSGPSGVGKSSVLNTLNPDAEVKTGEISEKIKRGKHTTRHSELIPVDTDTYIIDTPGFTALTVYEAEKEDLQYYFPEFKASIGQCKYTGCMHISEPDCAVKNAVKAGAIKKKRYLNYKQLYEELKLRRKW